MGNLQSMSTKMASKCIFNGGICRGGQVAELHLNRGSLNGFAGENSGIEVNFSANLQKFNYFQWINYGTTRFMGQ